MINTELLEKIKDMPLSSSSHESIEKGACIMEMVSYIAGEPWSDHPECACPILTEYAIRMNDRFNDEDRQTLKPLIVDLVGTRVDDYELKIARKRLIMWRNVTVTYPTILDRIKAPEHAADIRKFKNTAEGMKAAAEYLAANKDAIRKIAANAYANADANANANAKKFRSDLADISVETLRLAIAVKL